MFKINAFAGLLASLLMATSSVAQEPGWKDLTANPFDWAFGWDAADGSAIFVGCEFYSDAPSLIVQIAGSTPKEGSIVRISVDGKAMDFTAAEDGWLMVYSDSSADKFVSFVNSLEDGNMLVYSFDGLSRTVSLEGADKLLPDDYCYL